MTNKDNLISKEETTQENRVWVRITAACNVKCIFCLDEDAQNGTLIPDDVIRKEMRSGFIPGKKNRIIISGGEASIHPKFAEYIRYAKDIGYDWVQTVTNGNMFAKKEFCEKVFASGLDEVTFSIHGHTKELHDYFTGAPGSFDRALRALLITKKYFAHVVVSVNTVVNKTNVLFLPKILRFFMKMDVREFDLVQIIPFGRGFREYKNVLFYRVEDYLDVLHETWELSRLPGVHIWTNRFPVEAFEGYEDLIQDPRKIRSETMIEQREMFDRFIRSSGEEMPSCYGERCDVCFLRQYCHDYRDYPRASLPKGEKYIIGDPDTSIKDALYVVLGGEEYPSEVYKKYGNTSEEFLSSIRNLPLYDHQKIINVPRCIRQTNNDGQYERASDVLGEKTVGDYTKNYIMNLYRKKSLRCKSCKYTDTCEGIHINFIRSYGFALLSPIEI